MLRIYMALQLLKRSRIVHPELRRVFSAMGLYPIDEDDIANMISSDLLEKTTKLLRKKLHVNFDLVSSILRSHQEGF